MAQPQTLAEKLALLRALTGRDVSTPMGVGVPNQPSTQPGSPPLSIPNTNVGVSSLTNSTPAATTPAPASPRIPVSVPPQAQAYHDVMGSRVQGPPLPESFVKYYQEEPIREQQAMVGDVTRGFGAEPGGAPPGGNIAPQLVPQRSADFLDRLGIAPESREDALDAVRRIAEGLGNFQPVTTGDILFRTQRPQPWIAESTRRAMADERERLTPSEALMLNRGLGQNLFEGGMRRDTIQKAWPGLINLEETRQLMPYRQATLGLRERTLNQQEISEARRSKAEDRQERKLALDEKYRKILTAARDRVYGKVEAGLLRDIIGLRSTIQIAEDLRETVNLEHFGPVAGRWNDLARKLGLAPAEFVGDSSKLAFEMSNFIYLMTGKQMNEQEMVRLQRVLPQMWDSDEAFQVAMDSFIYLLQERYEAQMDVMKAAGRDVSGFEALDASDKATVVPAAGNEPVEVQQGDPQLEKIKGLWKKARGSTDEFELRIDGQVWEGE